MANQSLPGPWNGGYGYSDPVAGGYVSFMPDYAGMAQQGAFQAQNPAIAASIRQMGQRLMNARPGVVPVVVQPDAAPAAQIIPGTSGSPARVVTARPAAVAPTAPVTASAGPQAMTVQQQTAAMMGGGSAPVTAPSAGMSQIQQMYGSSPTSAIPTPPADPGTPPGDFLSAADKAKMDNANFYNNWGMGINTGLAVGQLGLGAWGLYQAAQAFDFNKNLISRNYENQAKAYNAQVEDRANTRYSLEYQKAHPNAAADEIKARSVNTSL